MTGVGLQGDLSSEDQASLPSTRPAPKRISSHGCFPECCRKGPNRWLLTQGTRPVWQGQRTLNRCSGNDFEQELFVPTTTAAFHDKARTVWMLLQE